MLTLVLLNPDIPCLCKHCRSRSVGFFRIYNEDINNQDLQCLPLSMWIYSKIRMKQSDWLKIRSGCGSLIYSAGQGLITTTADMTLKFLFIFLRKWGFTFHVYHLPSRQVIWNIILFSLKNKKINFRMSATNLLFTLRVNLGTIVNSGPEGIRLAY